MTNILLIIIIILLWMIVYSLPRGGFSNHKDKENLQDIRNYLEELAKLSYWDWVKVFDAIDTLGGIQKEIELKCLYG